MSFLLCHECYMWIEPREGRCPECLYSVEMGTPDPSPYDLESTIGRIVCRLGDVRVHRQLLPDRGTLYETTNGLFFIPYAIEHVYETVEVPSAETPDLWSLASLVWWPLMLLQPFLSPKDIEVREVRKRCPYLLTAGDSHQLPAFLMQNPGAFFVARRTIRAVRRRLGRWSIERRQGTPLRLKPAGNSRVFHARMSELVGSDLASTPPMSL